MAYHGERARTLISLEDLRRLVELTFKPDIPVATFLSPDDTIMNKGQNCRLEFEQLSMTNTNASASGNHQWYTLFSKAQGTVLRWVSFACNVSAVHGDRKLLLLSDNYPPLSSQTDILFLTSTYQLRVRHAVCISSMSGARKPLK